VSSGPRFSIIAWGRRRTLNERNGGGPLKENRNDSGSTPREQPHAPHELSSRAAGSKEHEDQGALAGCDSLRTPSAHTRGWVGPAHTRRARWAADSSGGAPPPCPRPHGTPPAAERQLHLVFSTAWTALRV
jgi:hypothetical protein